MKKALAIRFENAGAVLYYGISAYGFFAVFNA